MDVYAKAIAFLLNGLLALGLSLIMWRLTGSLWGWLVLFLPGAFLVLRAIWIIIHEKFF